MAAKMPPGEVADMPPGEVADMPPGEVADMPPREVADMPPREVADMPPREVADMPPREVADMPPREVAGAFVKQYYTVLSISPEKAHKFYAESSLLGWPESDGVITPVTTLSAINDKILSSNYKNCFAEVDTLDAQASQDGGVFVAVTGSFLENEKVTTIFFQTFFLARQEKGFFILNDILRVFDACVSGADDAPTEQSEASDISALEDTVTKVSSAEKASSVVEPAANANVNVTPAAAPAENANVPLVVEPISNANVSPAAAPAGNANLPLAVEPTSNANVSPVVALDANVNVSPAVAPAAKKALPLATSPAAKKAVPSDVAPAANVNVKLVAPASNVALKITYASVLAKTTPVSSPRAAPLTPRAAPVTPKSPVPLASSAPKASFPSLANGAPKPLASVTKVTTKSKTGGNSAPDTYARPEGRAVYLGNLPYDATKQRVAEVLRKFGPVRRHPDSVQIRQHSDDGFCCAFVEFESPDSARVAVQAHNVNFGEKVAYIAYKKSSYNRGSRSPTRGGYRHINENQSGRARATVRSPSSGQGAR